MSFLKKLVSSRFFPTIDKTVISGLATSAISLGLRLAHVYTVPADLQGAITAVSGVVGASVAANPRAAVKAYTTKQSIGSQIAGSLVDELAVVIDQNPALVHKLASDALTISREPLVAPVVKAVETDLSAPAPAAPAANPVSTPMQGTAPMTQMFHLDGGAA